MATLRQNENSDKGMLRNAPRSVWEVVVYPTSAYGVGHVVVSKLLLHLGHHRLGQALTAKPHLLP